MSVEAPEVPEAPIRMLRYPHFMRNRYGDESTTTVRGRHRLRRERNTRSRGIGSTTGRSRPIIPHVRVFRANDFEFPFDGGNVDSDN